MNELNIKSKNNNLRTDSKEGKNTFQDEVNEQPVSKMNVITEQQNSISQISKEDEKSKIDDVSAKKKTTEWSPGIIFLSLIAVACGSAASLSLKWSFTLDSYPCSDPNDCEMEQFNDSKTSWGFKHILNFSLSGLVYLLDVYVYHGAFGKQPIFTTLKNLENHRALSGKDKMRLYGIAAIPGLMDFTFSVCQSYATSWTRSSTTQMFINSNLIITTILGMIVFQKAYSVFHYVAICLILVGLVMAGVDGLTNPDDTIAPENEGREAYAIMLSITAAFARSIGVTVDQWVLAKYPCAPLKFMSIQNVYGSLGWAIIELATSVNKNPSPFIESWYMLSNNTTIVWALLLHATSACTMNCSLIIIGTYAGAVFRLVIQSGRGVGVWIVELIVQWAYFNYIALFGWIILIFGILFYSGSLTTSNMESKFIFLRRPITGHGRLKPPTIDFCSVIQIANLKEKGQISNELMELEEAKLLSKSLRTYSNNYNPYITELGDEEECINDANTTTDDTNCFANKTNSYREDSTFTFESTTSFS